MLRLHPSLTCHSPLPSLPSQVTPEEAREAREEVVSLLRELRPEAIALVDSWDWSDAALQSVLGRRDGNVRLL